MGRLHRLSFLLILIGPALAQLSYPNCSAGWEWSYNTLNQNPCNVAAYLEGECNGGQFNIQQLPSGRMYGGPTAAQSNLCECNTVVYSLVSACGACQGSSWILWSGWSANCTTVSSPSTYPNAIPNGTRVPHWAYLDVVTGGDWDISAAQSAGDSPEVTPTAPSTIQASSTATASPAPQSSNSTQKKSHAGAIAGGVVAGIAGAALLTAFTLWYLRRRRQRAPSPFAGKDEAFGMPEPDTSMSMGKYYDPSDPSTFPRPFVSPLDSATVIQTTPNSEQGDGGDPTRPHDRSQYTGLPLV